MGPIIIHILSNFWLLNAVIGGYVGRLREFCLVLPKKISSKQIETSKFQNPKLKGCLVQDLVPQILQGRRVGHLATNQRKVREVALSVQETQAETAHQHLQEEIESESQTKSHPGADDLDLQVDPDLGHDQDLLRLKSLAHLLPDHR